MGKQGHFPALSELLDTSVSRIQESLRPSRPETLKKSQLAGPPEGLESLEKEAWKHS